LVQNSLLDNHASYPRWQRPVDKGESFYIDNGHLAGVKSVKMRRCVIPLVHLHDDPVEPGKLRQKQSSCAGWEWSREVNEEGVKPREPRGRIPNAKGV
jgi:hypothetical protein